MRTWTRAPMSGSTRHFRLGRLPSALWGQRQTPPLLNAEAPGRTAHVWLQKAKIREGESGETCWRRSEEGNSWRRIWKCGRLWGRS